MSGLISILRNSPTPNRGRREQGKERVPSDPSAPVSQARPRLQVLCNRECHGSGDCQAAPGRLALFAVGTVLRGWPAGCSQSAVLRLSIHVFSFRQDWSVWRSSGAGISRSAASGRLGFCLLLCRQSPLRHPITSVNGVRSAKPSEGTLPTSGDVESPRGGALVPAAATSATTSAATSTSVQKADESW